MPSLQTFSWKARIYYEDTDVSGVVYHANYLRYFERCRSEWLRAVGYGQQQLMDELGIAFTIASVNIHYQVPARLDDLVEAQLQVAHLGRASLRFEQQLLRCSDAERLCSAAVKIACIDMAQFRPCAVPQPILEAIHRVC